MAYSSPGPPYSGSYRPQWLWISGRSVATWCCQKFCERHRDLRRKRSGKCYKKTNVYFNQSFDYHHRFKYLIPQSIFTKQIFLVELRTYWLPSMGLQHPLHNFNCSIIFLEICVRRWGFNRRYFYPSTMVRNHHHVYKKNISFFKHPNDISSLWTGSL